MGADERRRKAAFCIVGAAVARVAEGSINVGVAKRVDGFELALVVNELDYVQYGERASADEWELTSVVNELDCV